MKKYNATIEPYASRINETLNILRFKGDKIITSNELIYNIAKSTGLKSKKQRHIIKRFKKVINNALHEYLESEGMI